jgi:hypothetical protein
MIAIDRDLTILQRKAYGLLESIGKRFEIRWIAVNSEQKVSGEYIINCYGFHTKDGTCVYCEDFVLLQLFFDLAETRYACHCSDPVLHSRLCMAFPKFTHIPYQFYADFFNELITEELLEEDRRRFKQ